MEWICSIDWNAWATLAAGAMAVGGATFVGFKQTAILSRQTDIEALKIKTELFDKRFATYEAAADLLVYSNEYWVDRERLKQFLIKMRESQFLFEDPTVYVSLQEIFNVFNSIHTQREMLSLRRREEQPILPADSKREYDLAMWWTDRLASLHEVFDRDLKLALPGVDGHNNRSGLIKMWPVSR